MVRRLFPLLLFLAGAHLASAVETSTYNKLCNPFPKLIGGPDSHTGLSAIDYKLINNEEVLVAAGMTFDKVLSGGAPVAGVISLYRGEPNLPLKWAKVMTSTGML